ncbi:MAG: helix-turn-helix domain-containing protein, partial [Prevotellaceae bacterium]|nr:helix-turn-helix domain-containing protein [Candidatus Faecinaster equi]
MKSVVKNNSYVMYATWLDQVEQLEENGQFELAYKYIRAIMDYGIYGEYDNSDVMVNLLMTQTALGIDKAQSRYAAAVENGKKGGRPKTVDEEKIVELKRQGLTNKKIAEKVGCSDKTVSRTLKAVEDKTDKTQTKPLLSEMSDFTDKKDKTGQNPFCPETSEISNFPDKTGQNLKGLVLSDFT